MNAKTYKSIQEVQAALKTVGKGKAVPAEESPRGREYEVEIAMPVGHEDDAEALVAIWELDRPVGPDHELLDELIGDPVGMGVPPPDDMEVAAAVPEAEASGVPLAVVLGAVGPKSLIDLMMNRLRKLKEPTWGARQQLWNRLAKAEVKALEAKNELDILGGRHAARVAGAKEERARHVLTHCPPERWCESCTMGQPGEAPHELSKGACRAIPLINFYIACSSAAGEDGDSPLGKASGASLFVVDRDSGHTNGNVLVSKTLMRIALRKSTASYDIWYIH